MIRLPLSIVSPSGRRGRLSILIFHRVPAEPDPLFPEEPDAAASRRTCAGSGPGSTCCRWRSAVDMLYEGTLPSRALVDHLRRRLRRQRGSGRADPAAPGHDGDLLHVDRLSRWRLHVERSRDRGDPQLRVDELDLARRAWRAMRLTTAAARRRAIDDVLNASSTSSPELAQATDRGDRGRRRRPSAPPLMMRPQQLRSLRAMGMDIGAHTRHAPDPHPPRRDAAATRSRQSKRATRGDDRRAGRAVRLPERHAARRTTRPSTSRMARDVRLQRRRLHRLGCGVGALDRFQLPRFTPWDRSRAALRGAAAGNLRPARRAIAAWRASSRDSSQSPASSAPRPSCRSRARAPAGACEQFVDEAWLHDAARAQRAMLSAARSRRGLCPTSQLPTGRPKPCFCLVMIAGGRKSRSACLKNQRSRVPRSFRSAGSRLENSTSRSSSIGNATSDAGQLAHPGDLGQIAVGQREAQVDAEHLVDEAVSAKGACASASTTPPQ